MLQIQCSGTPFEIGHHHGSAAKELIERCIAFYTTLFQDSAKLTWSQVRDVATREFEPRIRTNWPAYYEEMRGIAAGAGKQVSDIIALNVRTEITFGLFSDGCTALSWREGEASFLAQNWDWMRQQKENLVILTIEQAGKPTIKTVAEAGMLAKIGLNSSGVGVCLNAIRAKGMYPSRLPCHLGLRMVLESESRDEAIAKLEGFGIASSCHMLVADRTGGIGVEWSHIDVAKLAMNDANQVFHSNHFLLPHTGVTETVWLEDSRVRIKRVEELCSKLEGTLCLRSVQSIFTDESNYPYSICRAQEQGNHSETLFNIVMDLTNSAAKVIEGRPTEPEAFYELSF
ncbi:hypothetical protein AAFC00_002989 [Neodothiora populina]|uniref:Peptidase C45 hydrolase domain-containing protein n=1 Tax=Neodothiora populina TaxID=2781224 RepID=A0ABR3P976_9PEZI